MLQVLRGFDPSLNLKYNKFYIGLEKGGQPYNFVTFRPKKNHLNLELKLPQTAELDAMIDNAGPGSARVQQTMGNLSSAPKRDPPDPQTTPHVDSTSASNLK